MELAVARARGRGQGHRTYSTVHVVHTELLQYEVSLAGGGYHPPSQYMM